MRGTGGTADRYTQFPVGYTRKSFVNTERGGKIEAASTALVDLIIDAGDPNKGRDNPLKVLNDASIDDRHIDLVPTAAVYAVTGVTAYEPVSKNRHHPFDIAIGGNPGKVYPIMYSFESGRPPQLEITNKGRPSFDIVFGEGQIFQGQAVIPTLKQLTQLVSGVVHAIQKAYNATI